MPTKSIFFSLSFYAYSFLKVGTFTSSSKDKKSYRSHKTVEIKIFLNFLLVDGRIRIRTRIQEAQKQMNPTDPDPDVDPDPEHCYKRKKVKDNLHLRRICFLIS